MVAEVRREDQEDQLPAEALVEEVVVAGVGAEPAAVVVVEVEEVNT